MSFVLRTIIFVAVVLFMLQVIYRPALMFILRTLGY